jgi:hypothetical protein
VQKVITLLLMIAGFFSCKSYELSEGDLAWQPYKVGDLLVFGSNKGDIDTVTIKSIEIYNNFDDQLAFFSNRIQTFFVNSEVEFLKIYAGKNGTKIKLNIRLGIKNKRFQQQLFP